MECEKVSPTCARMVLVKLCTTLEDDAFHEVWNRSTERMIAGQDLIDRSITLM